jgi:hypothetical protein
MRYIRCPTRDFESCIRDVSEHDEAFHHNECPAEDVPYRPDVEERDSCKYLSRLKAVHVDDPLVRVKSTSCQPIFHGCSARTENNYVQNHYDDGGSGSQYRNAGCAPEDSFRA